jgi:hypothetical protein
VQQSRFIIIIIIIIIITSSKYGRSSKNVDIVIRDDCHASVIASGGARAIKVDPPKNSAFFVFDEEVVVLLGLA